MLKLISVRWSSIPGFHVFILFPVYLRVSLSLMYYLHWTTMILFTALRKEVFVKTLVRTPPNPIKDQLWLFLLWIFDPWRFVKLYLRHEKQFKNLWSHHSVKCMSRAGTLKMITAHIQWSVYSEGTPGSQTTLLVSASSKQFSLSCSKDLAFSIPLRCK